MRRVFALLSLILLGACSGPKTDEAAPDPIALVSLGRAETGAVSETQRIYGVADAGAAGERNLSAMIEAKVAHIDAPAGSAVTIGQAVVTLTPTPASQLELTKAAADAKAADAAYARAQRLLADQLGSNADVENTRAAAQAADATLASLTASHQALVLRAPTAGYVQTVNVKPGDIVAAGTAVATVTGTTGLRARFGLDPVLARQVASGESVTVTTSDGQTFTAPVLAVDPMVDPQSHLASLVTAIPDGVHVGAGENLKGDVTVASHGDALTIPYTALLDDGGQPYVYVVKDGAAHRQDVKTGAESGDRIEITDGLAAGADVVTAGGTALDDGMKVRTK